MSTFRNGLGCLGLVVLALLSGACEEPPVPVSVPDVVGMTRAAAETAISGVNLTIGTVTSAYHATIPAGDVISQDPAPGSSVLPGTAVELVVSDGPEPVDVPDVVGLTQAAAETAITDANLAVGAVTEAYHETLPAGYVISQDPAFGSSVLPGTAVDLVVSSGPEPVRVPNLIGASQTMAEIVISVVDLTVGAVTGAYHTMVPLGHVVSQDPLPGSIILPGAAVNFTVAAPYSGGDGTSDAPYLISIAQDLLDLASLENSGDWNKHFLMTADINMADVTGFTPIAADPNIETWGHEGVKFTGVFDGGGHVIRNLVIECPLQEYVGLFGFINGGSVIQNIGLEGGSVTGRRLVGGLVGSSENASLHGCYTTSDITGTGEYVGGLAGLNYGDMSECYATGAVTGLNCVGGLVGRNYGAVTQCYATGEVTGQGMQYTGGLLGDNDGGSVTQCYATGEVTGGQYCTGGLVGSSYMGTVSESYATGTVTGSAFVGGLLGNISSGTVSGCHTTSTVTGNMYIGGLLGQNNFAIVTQCRATGTVAASGWYAGGFIAYNNHGTLTQCYAMSDVTGSAFVGGLVGVNDNGGTVTQSYAGGTITGVGAVGGLVGYGRSSAVSECYAMGAVAGLGDVGGLLGFNESGTVTTSFWDTETSGRATSAGGVGKTTAEMMTQSTFTDAGWDFGDVWDMVGGESYPYLVDNPEVD